MNDEEQAPPAETAQGAVHPDPGIAPEISRRVGSILDAVEREAARLRDEARGEAGRYLDHAKRQADGLVAERQRRIAELSDELIVKSEAVVARLDDAAPVRQGFENLVRALGDAAERLARETEMSGDYQPPPFYETGAEYGTPPPAPGPHPDAFARAEASFAPPPSPWPQAPPTYAPPPPPAPEHPDQYTPAPPWQPPPPPAVSGFESFSPQPHPARAPSTPDWSTRPEAGPAPPAQGPARVSNWRELDDARMIAIQMAASGVTRAGVREHLHLAFGTADMTGTLDEVFGPGSGEDARVPWSTGQR